MECKVCEYSCGCIETCKLKSSECYQNKKSRMKDIRKEQIMYKPFSDNTLMAMTKKEIIEHLRIAEHNHRVCEETIDQQYKNCMKLLKEERTDVIDEILKIINKEITSLEERLSIETYEGRWVDEEKCLFAIERLEHLSEQIKGDTE